MPYGKEQMAKKKPAIELKEVMGALDKRNRDWYSNLQDEKRKAFSPWMMMRYASSVQGKNSAHYILMVNDLVNKDFTSISKHPELQWKLMSTCGSGKVEFHPYIKPPTARKKKNQLVELINTLYPHMKQDEVDLFLQLNTKQDLKQLMEAHGYDDKSIKDILGKV
jgi:hypothetical protein